MKKKSGLTWGPLVPIGLALAGLAAGLAAQGPRCDGCDSLPALEQELAEQQWLRNKFREYTRQSDYQLTASDVGDLQQRVTNAFNRQFGRGDGGSGGRTAQPAMGTRVWTKDCDLVFYVKDAAGNNVPGPDGKPKVEPYDRKKLAPFQCKEVLDFMEKHEQRHRDTCRKSWKGGTQADWQKVEFVATDEVKAYEAGINVLEKAIAKLKAQCQVAMSGGVPMPTGQALALGSDPTNPAEIAKHRDSASRLANALAAAQPAAKGGVS
jgi:polyhydroxyalkanoate synthesis regulator phasin